MLKLHQPPTMLEYIEESLDKMLKRDLISILLNFESRMAEENNSNSSRILEGMHKFSDNFSKPQSELAVTKHVNTELTKRIVNMEHQCWANAQYSGKECFKVVGTSCQV